MYGTRHFADNGSDMIVSRVSVLSVISRAESGDQCQGGSECPPLSAVAGDCCRERRDARVQHMRALI